MTARAGPPGEDLRASLVLDRDAERVIPVAPTQEDPIAAGASRVIGGPLGRRALYERRRYVTPAVVLTLFVITTCFFGWVQKAPCRDPAKWQHEYQYTRMCYSDVEALYYAEGLNAGQHPYLDHEVEYPVVIGGLMQAAASVAHWFPTNDRAQRFFDVTALMLTAAAVVVVLTTSRLAGPRRPWDAAMVALAPALLLHAFTNWDLAATALAGVGLLAWSRRRPGWAGFWLGLAVATKLYPLVFLVPLLVLCWRAGRLSAWVRTAVLTVTTAVLVYLPILVFTPVYGDTTSGRGVVAPSIWNAWRDGDGWTGIRRALAGVPVIGLDVPSPSGGCPAQNGLLRFFTLNRTRGADFDSVYYAVQHNTGHQFGPSAACSSPATLNLVVAVLVIAVFAGVAALAVTTSRRPRVAQVLFLCTAGFVLVNKVDSPQYVIWLLPLAVLARPRWGAFLVWQATEVVVLITRFTFFVGLDNKNQGLTAIGTDGYRWFEGAVLARDAALLFLMALVIREMYRPEHDVVRRHGDDDPAGGVLDGVPDRHEPVAEAWTSGGGPDASGSDVVVDTSNPYAPPRGRPSASSP